MASLNILCFGTIFLSIFLSAHCKIPDYISVCQRKDPELAKCIINSILQLKPRMITGIPELGIPSLEPFNLDNLIIESMAAASSIETNLTDIIVHGASVFDIIKLSPKFTKNGLSLAFEVNVPHLDITGNYKMDTKILFLQLNGEGPVRANISDYHFICTMKGNKVKRGEHNYMEFDTMKCDLTVGKVFIYLDNLFNGNPILGRATNAVINENSDIFFEEIKPNLLTAISKKFTDLANRITLAFEYEELFP